MKAIVILCCVAAAVASGASSGASSGAARTKRDNLLSSFDGLSPLYGTGLTSVYPSSLYPSSLNTGYSLYSPAWGSRNSVWGVGSAWGSNYATPYGLGLPAYPYSLPYSKYNSAYPYSLPYSKYNTAPFSSYSAPVYYPGYSGNNYVPLPVGHPHPLPTITKSTEFSLPSTTYTLPPSKQAIPYIRYAYNGVPSSYPGEYSYSAPSVYYAPPVNHAVPVASYVPVPQHTHELVEVNKLVNVQREVSFPEVVQVNKIVTEPKVVQVQKTITEPKLVTVNQVVPSSTAFPILANEVSDFPAIDVNSAVPRLSATVTSDGLSGAL